MNTWFERAVRLLIETGMTQCSIAEKIEIDNTVLSRALKRKRGFPTDINIYIRLKKLLASRRTRLEHGSCELTKLINEYHEGLTCQP